MALAPSTIESLYGMRVRTDRVELRIPTNSDIKVLHRVARGGIHDPETMPFESGWTDKSEPDFGRTMQAELRDGRNSLSRPGWNAPFVIRGRDNGSPTMGVAWLRATETPGRYEISMWIARRFQGKGYGREAQAALLGLAFDGLKASEVRAGAFGFNGAARALARGAGFVEVPGATVLNRGEAAEYVDLMLNEEVYRAHTPAVAPKLVAFDRAASMFPVSHAPELVLGE